METMINLAKKWNIALNPLPEQGRRYSVKGAAGCHLPLEDIHLGKEREGISRSEHI